MADNGNRVEFPSLPSVPCNLPDWEYSMRREMQEIVPNVFLGPYCTAIRRKLSYLQQHGITHIVCIRHPIEANYIKPNFPDIFKYLVLDVIDSQDELILKQFPLVKHFIDECLACQGKVLLHGNGGLSRSAAFMIAYIMATYGLPYTKAFLFVQEKRYCINPNEGFARQLMEYEPIYLAAAQQRQQQQFGNGLLKRSHESDNEDDAMDLGESSNKR